MRRTFLVAVVALGFVPGQPGRAADARTDPAIAVFSPESLKWADAPPVLPGGAKVAVLEGDPAKEGPFVMRVKLPDGYRIPPHTHPKQERVTVISGLFF